MLGNYEMRLQSVSAPGLTYNSATVPPWPRYHGSLPPPIDRESKITHYSPQQPHQDGPAYYPAVATLSLGSHTVMHYYDLPTPEPVLSLFLEPRSLVITTQEQYTARAHGIDSVSSDRVGEFVWANAEMTGKTLCRDDEGAVCPSLTTEGEVLLRRTRYSLTFRDVARVMNLGVGGRPGAAPAKERR